MAEIKGVIVKKSGERAEIKVDKENSELKGLPKYLDCWNPIGAKPGDIVGAEYREPNVKTEKMIVYGLPVAGVIAGVAFGHSLATFFHAEEWPFILGGIILWLIVTVSYARIFQRDAIRKGKQAVIYEVEVQEMVIDMGKKPAAGN